MPRLAFQPLLPAADPIADQSAGSARPARVNRRAFAFASTVFRMTWRRCEAFSFMPLRSTGSNAAPGSPSRSPPPTIARRWIDGSRNGCILTDAQVVGGVMQDRLFATLIVLAGIGSTALI